MSLYIEPATTARCRQGSARIGRKPETVNLDANCANMSYGLTNARWSAVTVTHPLHVRVAVLAERILDVDNVSPSLMLVNSTGIAVGIHDPADQMC